MRRRIDQLLNGTFEYQTETPVLSDTELTMEADRGQILSGQFTLSVPSGKKIRGFVYSSNPRVSYEPTEFTGKQVRVRYQADTTGLECGEEADGAFTLCTQLGEISVPYTIKVREEEETLPAGPADAQALCELAHSDYDAASHVYTSEAFGKKLKAAQPEQYFLRRAIGEEGNARHRLEEFLIGCGLKQSVSVSLEQGTCTVERPARSMRQRAVLTADGWGYLELTVTSDAPFLRPEKKQLTTLDFVGNRYELDYIIDSNFLHAGRNFGRICIASCYQTLYLEVVVETDRRQEPLHPTRVQKMMQKRLLALYTDLRLRRTDTQHWIDRSMNVLGSYRRAGGENIFADLLQIQLYYADGKKTKAQRMLLELEREPGRFQTQDQYAFYLYLSTFFQREQEYVDQVEQRITQMFAREPSSWIMQWILLYLREGWLENDQARLEAISDQIGKGCSSPIMYLEALQYLNRNPYLLRNLDRAMLQVLWFGARQTAISEELSFQIANLAEHEGIYDRRRLDILSACYEQHQSQELVRAICQILIAGKCKDKRYFRWYALGVHYDLHITGLYEYYMETMDTLGIEKMPQIIRMYFSYNTTLNYHRKAAIYRSISDNRDNVPQVYRSSRSSIDHFITEQLSLGRIDKNLAVLYERFLTRSSLSRAQAERLTGILFSFDITCKNPRMKSVVVYHPGRKQERETLLRDGHATVRIYTEDARILLVDHTGKRYASTSLYMAERFLDSPLLTTWCRELAPDHQGLVLHLCGMGTDIEAAKRACEMESLTGSFRARMRSRVLDYYCKNPRDDELYGWLSGISIAEYVPAGKSQLMSLYTQRGMFEEAFSVVRGYGAEDIDLSLLVRVCSQIVLLREYEEDRALLSYCERCFRYGKYDDNIISYLLMYYDGPIEDMKRLWNIGHSYEADTLTLEEKILSMVLFSRTGTQGTEQIFASYQHRMGKKKICRAYVILKSYEYFVKNLPVADLIFGYLEQILHRGGELDDVCALALLQYYSGMENLDADRQKRVRRMLDDFSGRGMRFAFYQKFPRSLRLPLQIDDRVFLEYVADPARQVYVSWKLNGAEAVREPMQDRFEGIFVQEFILFEGDVLECRMEEMEDDQVVRVSDPIMLAGRAPQEQQSRFAIISSLAGYMQAMTPEEIEAELDRYFQMDYITREMFPLN